jgi:hypothetical protein
LYAQLSPGELCRGLGTDDKDVLAVNDENVVFSFVSGGLLGTDGTRETTLRGVVLQQVGQVVGRNDIADGDDVERRTEKALLYEGAEDEAANATETVDCDFYSHNTLRVLYVIKTFLNECV